MKSIVFTVLGLALISGTQANPSLPCVDWVPYKEEFCFKVFDNVGLETFENAEKACTENDASLLTIRYEEEQKFLTDLLFNKSKLADNVWLGASFDNSSKYRWKDGSELVFSNWDRGSPKNHDDYCVDMIADEETRGKWVDESCKKRYAVVCQKKQTWSIGKLQEILMEVKQNPVPVGFTYVQLPKEKGPTEIWPWMVWKDVSSDYAGVFFRTEGGGAAGFGQIQEANSNYLKSVQNSGTGDTVSNVSLSTSGAWTNFVYTGKNDDSNRTSLHFALNPGEVRPRNMAMRIWKRIA